MVEGTQLKGVARLMATGSAGLLFLGTVLAVMSVILPFWAAEQGLDETSVAMVTEYSMSLWVQNFEVGLQVPDGAGGTAIQTISASETWDNYCSVAGNPDICDRVRSIRAFCILSAIFGLMGTLSLVQSRTVSPLLLVAGAFLGALEGICAIIGVGVGITSVPGVAIGLICILATAMFSFIGVSAALYGANIVMPVDAPPGPKRFTFRQRAKDQREKDLELGRSLAEKHGRNEVGRGKVAMQDDGAGSTASSKKVPEMLKKVLNWTQEHAGDVDADTIPQEYLELAFKEMDADGSGSVEMEELIENLALCGLNVDVKAAENVMREIDKDCSGDIDIHEFVDFFRRVEELDKFQAKSQQRAQFMQFLCNFCFIAHIIIVSVLLMEFINMEEADDPDSYLIYRQMLIAFCSVLAILLLFVICIPALRLTVGGSLKAWQRQYSLELEKRSAGKKPGHQEEKSDSKGPRSAGLGSTADGLTDLTVNAALYGHSYRLSKNQNMFLQEAHQSQQSQQLAFEGTGRSGFMNTKGSLASTGGMSRGTASRAGRGVVMNGNNQFERYNPDAYREAARASMQAGTTASFSPMQVRDLNIGPQDEPYVPGFLALEDPANPPSMVTGTGFYHREL